MYTRYHVSHNFSKIEQDISLIFKVYFILLLTIFQQCLSPKMKPHPTNGTDMLQSNDFLALSNTLQPDLIPTKDKGLHADSGCSEFEETWPSTDLTGSSKIESPLQHNSSTNVVGSCIDEKVGEPIQRMENYEQKSTIAR